MLAVEQLAFNDFTRSRDTDLQFLNRLSKTTASGSGEQDDLLSGEVIALQEGVDEGGGAEPYADKIIMPTLAILFRLAICLPRKCRHFLF